MGTCGQRTRIQHGIPPNVYMGGTMTGTKDTLVMPVVLVHDFIHFPRSEYADTLVTELDLVCDYAQWPHISTSLFYVGSLLGNIIFGNIADRYEIV